MTLMSSAGLRFAAATDGIGSSRCTASACSPRRPAATPNSTRVPAFSDVTPSGNAEECT